MLSIPNFWLTFYIYGFYHHPRIDFKNSIDSQFSEFDYTNRCVFRVSSSNIEKIIVIDTDDPTHRHDEYVHSFDCIFLSQKLLDKSYPSSNYYALPPHFPIKSFIIQKMIWKQLLNPMYTIKNLKNIKATNKLKPLDWIKGTKMHRHTDNYIFYQRSLWKKEALTNLQGYKFITYFKNKLYEVEGGLYRSDGFKTDSNEINSLIKFNRISTNKYTKKTINSLFCFNTPAIRGAISWRFAEYLALGKAIISTPFKVEIPGYILEQLKIFFISENLETFDQQLDEILYGHLHEISEVEKNNYLVFQKHLTPLKQVDYILNITFQYEHISKN